MEIKITYKITKSVIKKALVDHYYNICGGFSEDERNQKDIKYSKELDNLTKLEAESILRIQLKLYGLQGAYHDGFFESATDVIEQRQYWDEKVSEWVELNYPELK